MTQQGRGRYRDALRQRDFRLLVVSFVVDAIGSWSYSVVLSVVVFDRTHSTTWLAGLTAARWGASLAVNAPAGVLADRFERTRVMLTSALLSTALMSIVAVAVATDAPIWTLLVVSAAASVVGAPYVPAAGALTPEVVGEKDLAAANALFATLDNATVVVGPLIGGALLALSATAGIVVNAASFAVAALIVSRLAVRSRGSAQAGGGVLRQWLVGFRSLVAKRVAFFLVLFCALDSAIYGASTVIFLPLSAHLGTGLRGYSYLLAGNALGAVAAAALANRLSASTKLTAVIFGSIVVEATPFAGAAATGSPAITIALMFVSGAGMIIVDVLALSALQRDVDKGVLSRVLGVFDMCVVLATMAGSLGFAALLPAAGLRWTLIIIGVAFPLVAAIGVPTMLRGEREAAARNAQVAELADLLARLDIFAESPRPVLERLALSAERHDLPAGDVVLRQGEAADALWVLTDGSLAVEQATPDGALRELPAVVAPGYVGEIGLVRRVPRTATVQAREPSTLFRVDGETFVEAYESTPPSAAFVQLAGTRYLRTSSGFTNSTASERSRP